MLLLFVAGSISIISAQSIELSERIDPRIYSIAKSIVGTTTPGLRIVVMRGAQTVHAKLMALAAAAEQGTAQGLRYVAATGNLGGFSALPPIAALRLLQH